MRSACSRLQATFIPTPSDELSILNLSVVLRGCKGGVCAAHSRCSCCLSLHAGDDKLRALHRSAVNDSHQQIDDTSNQLLHAQPDCNKGCQDTQPGCQAWKDQGECITNPAFMLQACMAACGLCAAPKPSKSKVSPSLCHFEVTRQRCPASQGPNVSDDPADMSR